MKIRESKSGFLPQYASVKVSGYITEVTEMLSAAHPQMVNLNKDEMLNVQTGEVVLKNHAETKADSPKSVLVTLRHIRDLVNANCLVPSHIRWCTFTYGTNMCDRFQLMRDWDGFIKRFKRWCRKMGIPYPRYITVAEPQGRGAWHLHVIFIWDQDAPFIDNNTVLWPMWGHGFTKIKSVDNVDNIGAYFSAYLADLDITDMSYEELSRYAEPGMQIEEKWVEDERTKKKILKGGRLCLYPSNMNIVRHSQDIKYPVTEKCTPSVAQKKKTSAGTETFSRTYELVDDNGMVINVIRKTYYNNVRKEKASKGNNTEYIYLGDPACAEFIYEFCEEEMRIKSVNWVCRDENLSLAEYVSDVAFEQFQRWLMRKYSVRAIRSVADGHELVASQEDELPF